MEKIEVEQGFLSSLIALAQKPFLNSKEEEKDKKEDDDEMEYKGEKYSKKELINCYKAKQNEMAKEAEEHEAKETKEEEKEEHEEKKNSKDADESDEYFNSVKKAVNTQVKTKRVLPETSQAAIERGKAIFG